MFETHEPEGEGEHDAFPDEATSEIEEGAPASTSVALDPDALRSQRFILSFFGYDRGEVRAFLAHIAERLERAGEPGAGASAALSFDALGEEVSRILATTTEVANELRERFVAEARRAHAEAQDEARATTERAEARAKEVVEAAERRAAEMVAEAEERAGTLVREAEEEAERVRAAEHRARSELTALREMLSNVTETSEPEEDR